MQGGGERKQKKKGKRVDAGYFLSKQEEEDRHLGDRHRGKESEVDGACHQKIEIKSQIKNQTVEWDSEVEHFKRWRQ